MTTINTKDLEGAARCDRIRLARAAIAETTIDDTPNINQLREVLP